MKKAIIFVNRNNFIYNKEKYSFDKLNEVQRVLKKDIKIVILEEELCLKKFDNNAKKFQLEKFVDSLIEKEFPQNGDILYDYEKKNNVIVIYYIRGAKRIERLAEGAKKIEVKPIQLIIKEVMRKELKANNNSGRVLIKINEYYYYISFEAGIFDHCKVKENKASIINEIYDDINGKEIFVDKSAIDVLTANNNLKIIEIDIGSLINETIYEKQKFYSRKSV
ncbi:hypothetical protein [Clostridium saccharoperbutylacetonicum]|uniref:hypothetical protein n=1 Tax=Clostridium saccharoperbutylacetonicum TaxID=36745 RepID=UPI0039EA8157